MISPKSSTGIWSSLKTLKGNTRVSVIFEPLWGIPYALYSFYLGLYMKSRGISDVQLGFLISIGFIASIIFAAVGGAITDALGRKRTTLIFDLLAWPLALLIYLLGGSFWAFALAQVINSLVKIAAVSWNLMVVEDADPEQQVAAYNLINAINIFAGIFTPLAGLMIKQFGMVLGEQILLGFAVISMLTMMLLRNVFYRETKVGQQILTDRQRQAPSGISAFGCLRNLQANPRIGLALVISVLFNAYIPLGTFYSLYYGPFLTEALKLDKAAIALLGGVNAGVILLVFLFAVPLVARFNRTRVMVAGIGIQMAALGLIILIPRSGFGLAAGCVVLFALGFGITKPYMDSLLAGVTSGKERAGIFGLFNTGVAICSSALGWISGMLYQFNPRSIYLISLGILFLCIVCLIFGEGLVARQSRTAMTQAE